VPEKIAAVLSLKSLMVFCGGMIVAGDGEVNWKAFGLLVAVLIPLMGAVAMGGIFAGGMANVPSDIKEIDNKLDSIILSSDKRFDTIERDLAVLKIQADHKK